MEGSWLRRVELHFKRKSPGGLAYNNIIIYIQIDEFTERHIIVYRSMVSSYHWIQLRLSHTITHPLKDYSFAVVLLSGPD